MTASTAIPQEIEAKLLVPRAATLRAVARLKELGPYRLRARQTVRLHTIYLDTAEFTLARRGVALRLRRERARWETTVKWSGREDGMVHTRPELTVRLSSPPSFPFSLPPGPLTAYLAELIAGRSLAPILLSEVRRQRFAVRVGEQLKAPAFAELALDHVRLSAPSQRRAPAATYCEVEIELEVQGMEPQMLDFARLLSERFALAPAEGSKFSRGLALLYGPGLLGSGRTGRWAVPRQRPAARKKANPPTSQQ